MITSFLSSSIQAFLARHGFISLTGEQQYGIRVSPSPRKRRKIEFEGEFDDVSEGHPSYGEQTDACPSGIYSQATKLPTGLHLSQTVCVPLEASLRP